MGRSTSGGRAAVSGALSFNLTTIDNEPSSTIYPRCLNQRLYGRLTIYESNGMGDYGQSIDCGVDPRE